MRMALHDPENGYYARNIRQIGGQRGDFTTVPMRDGGILAEAIARWTMRAMRDSGCRDLIEIGPGEGRLMRDVLAALPPLRRLRTRPRLVESSPVLAARQRTCLGRRVIHHRTINEALEATGGRAVVFSNELIDAFPVRIFQRGDGGWRELGVELDERGKVAGEHLLDPGPLPDSSVFKLTPPAGWRVEVHDAYRQWLHGWLPAWRAGAMLVIDYGNTAGEIYHRRPHGTIRGYLLNQRLEGPAVYQNPGRQDLTADVNFTDLARWAAPWCECSPPQPLAGFLGDHLACPPGTTSPMGDVDALGGAFHVMRFRPNH